MVKSSGLRGRGGAGFPTGVKWSFLPEKHPGPVYFCVNADESEPGTFVNRVQMELDPHQVLEGIILSCYATRATTAYVYLRYEYPLCRKRMQAAIDECYAAGYLGHNILGSGFSLDVYHPRRGRGLRLRRGDGPDREPRGPPGLAADQAAVPRRRRAVPQAHRGEQRRDARLREADRRPRRGVVPLDGHAAGAATIPATPAASARNSTASAATSTGPAATRPRWASRCRQLIDEFGGGVWKGRRAKAAVPGGLSTGVVDRAEFDTPLDFSAPMRVGCLGLGTACVVVLDETYPIVDFLHNSCRFFAHESCGQCTPCREGTHWALEMLDRIKAGRGRLRDLDLLLEIGDSIGIIPGTTICGLADGAAWPIKTAIKKFRGELEEYIRRTNPQGYAETAPGRPGI